MNKKLLSIICSYDVPAHEKAILDQHFDVKTFPDDPGYQDDSKTAERIAGADVVYTNNTLCMLSARALDHAPKLTHVVTASAGTDHIDLVACQQRNIKVHNYPDFCTNTLAEFTLGFMLAALRKMPQAIANVKNGGFHYNDFQGREIGGRTVLLIGNGRSANRLRTFLNAMGAQIIYADSKISKADVLAMAKKAEIISLHMPHTSKTKNFCDAEFFAQCRQDLIFINLSRGKNVDSAALASFLRTNPEATAMLDVLDQEPPDSNHPLTKLPNCFITPHTAWNTTEAYERLHSGIMRDLLAAANYQR